MSVNEIAKLRAACGDYQLDGREVLIPYTDAELSHIYNGAGPDRWLPLTRDVLTSLMMLYKPVVLIHDVQFEHSDGSEAGFQHTVACWRHNIRVIFDDNYPLWTWRWLLSREYRLRRAYWWSVMKTATIAISGDEARKAWIDAHNRRPAVSLHT